MEFFELADGEVEGVDFRLIWQNDRVQLIDLEFEGIGVVLGLLIDSLSSFFQLLHEGLDMSFCSLQKLSPFHDDHFLFLYFAFELFDLFLLRSALSLQQLGEFLL